MSCRDLTELVTDYSEGRMPLFKRWMFRLHIAMCGVCRRYVRQVKLTVDTLGKMPPEPMPDEVKAALMSTFRHWKSGPAGGDPRP